MKLSTLVGRQKPIVDKNLQAEHTVAASSGLAPADIARILSSSRNVQRARQIFRFANPPTPMTIPVPTYTETGEQTVEVDYVGHVLDQLVEPTTSAEEQVSRILKIKDVLGGAFANWRAEVFQWYEFLATFFALNQKYSASAILYDHLHLAFRTDYDALGDYQKNLCLKFLGETIPYRLGTVLFKVIVDICESFREIEYPPKEDKRGSVSIAGEEVTPMVLVIDLESIHSPVDAILHSQKEEQGGLLESLFASGDKGFNEEQRVALHRLRPELAANPLVMSLYYRLASAIIRYHGRLYINTVTWQDYFRSTAQQLDEILQRCRNLPVEMNTFPDFKGMFTEVVKAKRVRQKGVGTKTEGILDRLQGRTGDLRSRYERRMGKVVTDLTISGEDETIGLTRIENLFVELDLHQELSTEAKAEITAKWAKTALENNLYALAGRAHHLRSNVGASSLPSDGLSSRFEGVEQLLVQVIGDSLEAIHLYERYLARDPDPAVQEHLVSSLDSLATVLVDHHKQVEAMATRSSLPPLRCKMADLLNPIPFYMKELALLDEIGASKERCQELDTKIAKAEQILGLEKQGSVGPVAHWAGRIDQITSRIKHTDAQELDCIEELAKLFGELEVTEELSQYERTLVVDKWMETTLKSRLPALAGQNEHLRVRLLMASLPMGGDDEETTRALNQQLLYVFSTLTDACALMLRAEKDPIDPRLAECLYETFVDVGDMLVAFQENYEVIAQNPNLYEVTRQQLSDLRDPLSFFVQARRYLEKVLDNQERLDELDWKIKDARRV